MQADPPTPAATNRPGKGHREAQKQRQAIAQEAKSRKALPDTCPSCESILKRTRPDGPLVCVLCEAREIRATRQKIRQASHGEAEEHPPVVRMSEEEGATVTVALDTFTVTGLAENIDEPNTVDEDLFAPTDAQPGSLDRLEQMSQRYQRGLPIFHSEDKDAWSSAEEGGQAALAAVVQEQEELDKDPDLAGELLDLAKKQQEEKELAAV